MMKALPIEQTNSHACYIILLGATTFTFVFREMHGDEYLVNLIREADLPAMGFLLLVMIVVFVAGFFIDFIEIIFIIVPVVAPIFLELEIDQRHRSLPNRRRTNPPFHHVGPRSGKPARPGADRKPTAGFHYAVRHRYTAARTAETARSPIA